jgi:voltage-gated potassium channel
VAEGSSSAQTIRLPRTEPGPFRLLATRFAVASGAIVFIALVAYIGRSGYRDAAGDGVSFLDALYYASVSVTTTGYGDIAPVSDGARLVTTLVVTPVRVLFLVLLVGTTVEILTERSRHIIRLRRWSKRLSDHVIICGYGTKGRSAIDALLGKGLEPGQIVVIDERSDMIDRANADGFAGINGSAASAEVLRRAGIERASSIVVAPDRDDTSVLVTLTARELNRRSTIVSAVREAENVHLLRESGADSVITSSGAAGRLLGIATHSPTTVRVLEDLLEAGSGIDIVERPARPEEIGAEGVRARDQLLVAVIRGAEVIGFADERAERIEGGDRLLCLCVNRERSTRREGGAKPT